MCGDIERRSLVFFDESHRPLQKISAVLYAFSIFPEDERSREQALALFQMENAAYLRDKENYEESELVKALVTWSNNRTGQRFAAGLTMLAFQMHFSISGDRVSLYKAAKSVETALKAAKRSDDRPLKLIRFEGQELVLEGVRVPAGRREIERSFQNYRSVSHIIASDFLCTNALTPMRIFDRTFEMDAFLLNTARAIELTMLDREPELFGNPWLVSPNLPPILLDFGAAEFNGDFLNFLWAGVKPPKKDSRSPG